MFTESAELYDVIYSSFKDYGVEVGKVAALLRTVHPRCQTILDAGCGTGEHARRLVEDFGYEADGLDINPDFLRIARTKHPTGRFVEADMAAFHLGRYYDAVLCLFSSIGYLRNLGAVRRAFECFREHLAAEGVVVVEPWYPPGVLEHGHRSTQTAETPTLRVIREDTTEVAGRLSRLRFEYTIETQGRTRHASELHELGLFTVAELLEAFEAAGLDARHEPTGLTGRGLYIARMAT